MVLVFVPGVCKYTYDKAKHRMDNFRRHFSEPVRRQREREREHALREAGGWRWWWWRRDSPGSLPCPVQVVVSAQNERVDAFYTMRSFFTVRKQKQEGKGKAANAGNAGNAGGVGGSNSDDADPSAKKSVDVLTKLASNCPFLPGYYLLSEDEMSELGYPQIQVGDDGNAVLPQGWVEASDSIEELPPDEYLKEEHIVAVDCEMCKSAQGSELTRCSLVSLSGRVLYDSLVLPENPIVDFLTEFR